MNTQTYTLKELKERVDEGELDLSLSTLTEEDVPIKQIVINESCFFIQSYTQCL